MRYVLDIESNNLLTPALDYTTLPYKLKQDFKVWCVVVRNIDNGQVVSLYGETLTYLKLKEALYDCTELIFHNGINFDAPVLQLYGLLDYTVGYPGQPSTLYGKECILTDTLIWSKLLNADRINGHSLDSWGKRLGNYKGEFNDWTQFSQEMLDYCITPDSKLLSESLHWKPAYSFSVGDKILGFDEDGPSRKYKTAVIEVINYEDRPVYEVTFKSGKKIKTTKEHRWLVSHENHGGSSYTWLETGQLKAGSKYASKVPKLLNVWEEDISKDAGWLAGMFDGEGYMSSDRFSIGVAQRPTNTLVKLERVLHDKKFKVSKRDVKKNSDCVALRLTGGAFDKIEFLGKIRPERLIEKFSFEKMGRLENRNYLDEVVSVVETGVEQIIKIQTSTRTFVCEGYPMHNCIQDTNLNKDIYFELLKEKGTWDFSRAYSMEIKLQDLTLKQEVFGFSFNEELAKKNLQELGDMMKEIAAQVDPILPPKKLTQSSIKEYTPPAKQFKKDGTLTAHMAKFIQKHNLQYVDWLNEVTYEGKTYSLPLTEPLKTVEPATTDDLDVVKGYLLSLGWRPSEVKERDLTKKADKTARNQQEIIETIDRYVKQTLDSVYKYLRLEILEVEADFLRDHLVSKIDGNKPIYVPTSPKLTIGLEKEICPDLIRLGKEAEFAKSVVKYFTYRHRKNSIAGGVLDEDDEPATGFLSCIREDGRIPTPADILGANTGRYRHKIVCNIPRVSSLYGYEMRSLFGPGKGLYQLGFDFASLEARIMGHYVIGSPSKPYTNGVELAAALVAKKPLDIHTINAAKLGIPRDSAKSFSYASIYGAQPKKLAKMLGCSESKAKQLFNAYWEAVPALKELKDSVEKYWESTGKKYILGLDGRRLVTRSKHSLINVLFQSGGAIVAKWSIVRIAQLLDEQGLLGNPFTDFVTMHKVWAMIAMHDEMQYACHPKLLDVRVYPDDEAAQAAIMPECSTIGHGKKGSYIAFKTSPIECIDLGIKQACKELRTRTEMGFEYSVGPNWAECH